MVDNKTLTCIYITHGCGDHFFGIPVLQRRSSGVMAVATEQTIAQVA
ncbi:hypothetical protein SS1G_04883 [Sclerotinia sclerotiorum 1980 UF-70]|uniref:Metallo-beta-lactamase domain-containing protein n=1 Tax=Sclerotinia sclerotiorum (strain ATCC 18683 / 1980 / Ss-1) TaxID=665079 RepID=A7EHU1_SCLS1|nr:hypothetical protein SS1G_04883 [Sclerotinia sclerotiorum 1980 UF-70]EDO02407.1 hypothetical protein SS1G_04883 [Sclerotinia sclerotiorum 1980 UF-70]